MCQDPIWYEKFRDEVHSLKKVWAPVGQKKIMTEDMMVEIQKIYAWNNELEDRKDRFSVRDICNQLGISKTTYYRYIR
jgi:hypothetical protein